jgi:hypothetical protein
MASTFSGIALLLGLWANRPKKYIYRRITAGFILATMILVAYGFLSAYDQYFQKIKEACRNPNNNVLCARHAVQIEAVIFSMALALLFIGLILWIILSFFNNDEKEEEYIAQFYDEEEEEEEEDWNGSHDTKTSPSKQTVDPIPSPGLSSQGYYPPDEMVAWRDVSLFKEDATFEKQKNKGGREHAQEKSTTHARGNCISRGAAAGTNYPSIGPNEKPSLPPPPTATIKPTVQNTSPTRPLATKLAGLNSSFKNKRASSSSRKASHDSAHTFGGSKSPRRRSQGSPLAEFPEERSSNKTPTSMSPHPFPSPLDQKDPQSLYSLDNNSSSNSNSSGYFGIKPGHVPVLNMPPTGFVEHPLNKKIITDKRIQTYLQSKE